MLCGDGLGMSVPFFPNVVMDIYSYNTDNDDYDYYGKKNEYVLKETVEVDMQPLSPTSSLREFGKILQDTYTIIMSIDVNITDTDKIIIGDIEYEIVGSVDTWNHVLPHKEMLIRKLRKKEGLS